METNLRETDLYLWGEGTNTHAYLTLGCHKVMHEGYEKYRFAVWAPNARAVSVVGDFNGWNLEADRMVRFGDTGIWYCYIGIVAPGATYKFAIEGKDGKIWYRADPFAFRAQLRPGTSSEVWDIEDGYKWGDEAYMKKLSKKNSHTQPMSIYEVHLGSWVEGLTFEDLADKLVKYVSKMGYTHIELMPVSEYPLDDSWGYQVTGYYAITARYGTPTQFKMFIDACHQAGLGVIVDWVPAHFTRDEQGLGMFDGTALYEHPDPRRGDQPQWGTKLFNYEKNEVRSFLISNAVFLMKEYHVDGIRVDAVSCMLYLDYGRDAGQWLPNKYGGHENLGAIDFFRQLSDTVHKEFPGRLLFAEESTAFGGITASTKVGGLGFDYKWNMGWMNDTLKYMSMDSIFRKFHHDQITFSMCYAFSEHYALPFSHDEVVHGKKSLIGRMHGPYEDQFSQLRLLYMYQYAHPGKKLNFMGNEFGQFIEWNFKQSLDWLLLEYPAHNQMQEFVSQLNKFYTNTPAFYQLDDSWEGFQWMRVDDASHSILAFVRRDKKGNEILCVFNFTPVGHNPYRIPMTRSVVMDKVMSNVDIREFKGIETDRDDEGNHFVEIELSPYEAAFFSLAAAPEKEQPKPAKKPAPKKDAAKKTKG